MTDMTELTSSELAERRAGAIDLIATRPQIDLLLVDAINAAKSVEEIDRLLTGRKRKQRSAAVQAPALPVQLELDLEPDHSSAGNSEMSAAAEAPELSASPAEAYSAASAHDDCETELVANFCKAAMNSLAVPTLGEDYPFADHRRLARRSFCPQKQGISRSARGPPDQRDRPHGGPSTVCQSATSIAAATVFRTKASTARESGGLPLPYRHSAEP